MGATDRGVPLKMCAHENFMELSMENVLERRMSLNFELHTKQCGDDAWNFASYQLEGLVNVLQAFH